MLNRLWRIVLRWMQRRCDHIEMKADILEGDGETKAVAWCETCGAVSVYSADSREVGSVRMPEPTWHPKRYPSIRAYIRDHPWPRPTGSG